MKGVINIRSLKSDHKRKLLLLSYCASHKNANSEVQKPTDDCVFRCRDYHNEPLTRQNFTLTGSKGHGV